MVALAVLYADLRCVCCGLYPREYVGMNPLGKRPCPTFTGRVR